MLSASTANSHLSPLSVPEIQVFVRRLGDGVFSPHFLLFVPKVYYFFILPFAMWEIMFTHARWYDALEQY